MLSINDLGAGALTLRKQGCRGSIPRCGVGEWSSSPRFYDLGDREFESHHRYDVAICVLVQCVLLLAQKT